MTLIKDLLQVQLGTNDSDWGTLMPGTVKLMGVNSASLKSVQETEMKEELRGTVHPGYIAVVKEAHGEGSLEMHLTYEDAPYFLDALLGAAVSGTSDGVRDYTASADWASSDPQPSIFTIKYGSSSSDNYVAGMPGATLTKFNLSGESGGQLMLSADFLGKEVATSDGTLAALSDRDVNVVLGAHGALWIDVSSDTVGTTAITTTAFAFELDVEPGRSLATHMGSLTPSGYRHGKFAATLQLTLEMTADMYTIFQALLDPAVTQTLASRVVRLKFTSGGLILQLDFAGVVLEKPEAFTDRDGVVTLEMTLTAVYNSVLGTWMKANSTVPDLGTLA